MTSSLLCLLVCVTGTGSECTVIVLHLSKDPELSAPGPWRCLLAQVGPVRVEGSAKSWLRIQRLGSNISVLGSLLPFIRCASTKREGGRERERVGSWGWGWGERERLRERETERERP